jgi:UDP-N-acetylmuramoyl-L-alanyl-D-glutamate--2,6-diaminopimelate ligase
VFGAPGKRDKQKRPEMAKIVEKHSDVVIVTDDDASSENRRDILDGVMSGIARQLGEQYYVIPNRRDAIALAVQIAQPGDYVLLAGK